jgi:hypothetical protein
MGAPIYVTNTSAGFSAPVVLDQIANPFATYIRVTVSLAASNANAVQYTADSPWNYTSPLHYSNSATWVTYSALSNASSTVDNLGQPLSFPYRALRMQTTSTLSGTSTMLVLQGGRLGGY